MSPQARRSAEVSRCPVRHSASSPPSRERKEPCRRQRGEATVRRSRERRGKRAGHGRDREASRPRSPERSPQALAAPSGARVSTVQRRVRLRQCRQGDPAMLAERAPAFPPRRDWAPPPRAIPTEQCCREQERSSRRDEPLGAQSVLRERRPETTRAPRHRWVAAMLPLDYPRPTVSVPQPLAEHYPEPDPIPPATWASACCQQGTPEAGLPWSSQPGQQGQWRVSQHRLLTARQRWESG
ncbi:hypothetical protein SAMN05192571_10690 [Pleomorphomonas diazotrophica]|nr:hypothetical protein SAMN05192571_10690 [Pleomorphomonas diazotrophica]